MKQAKDFVHLSEATLEQLIDFAEADDKDSIELFQEIGSYMGTGMANLIKTFNPQLVIVGNRLAKAKDWIEDPIVETIKKSYSPSTKPI